MKLSAFSGFGAASRTTTIFTLCGQAQTNLTLGYYFLGATLIRSVFAVIYNTICISGCPIGCPRRSPRRGFRPPRRPPPKGSLGSRGPKRPISLDNYIYKLTTKFAPDFFGNSTPRNQMTPDDARRGQIRPDDTRFGLIRPDEARSRQVTPEEAR